MIDPIIFTINIGNFRLDFHWYGVLVVLGIMVAAWVSEKELVRRGGKSDWIWDGLLWVLPAAIIGARVWYIVNDIIGGGRTYLDNPQNIIRITDGGLHIFGALAFGALAAVFFARRKKIDLWLLVDSVAPSLLIGQAIARPANFINQELYGPPTTLPWGISIDSTHRIPPFDDLEKYPLDVTRFHPTFLYEMIWNLLAAGVILWLVRRYKDKVKPGSVLAAWLMLAGLGRFFIEFFRPDQPKILGTLVSLSQVVAVLMFTVGLLWLLIRCEVLKLSFISPGPSAYNVPKDKKWKK